ncbi:MAG: IS1/IS1595 family N-terminal zinc-binding domain-containing protein, partial [Candidatus Bathyarchaeia archaeon]
MEDGENSDIQCPQCGSKRLYRDGLRYLADGSSVQRWLCRECAYRFTDPKQTKRTLNCQSQTQHVEKIEGQILNSPNANTNYCQGSCEAFSGKAPTSMPVLVKTLAEVESRSEKRAAGATSEAKTDIKGK